jgi:hypothetical protein
LKVPSAAHKILITNAIARKTRFITPNNYGFFAKVGGGLGAILFMIGMRIGFSY